MTARQPLGPQQGKLMQLKDQFDRVFTLEEIKFIINHFPIGICLTDANRTYVDVNDAYLHLYGYERKELIGNPFTMVVPESMRTYLSQAHDAFLENAFELEDVWEVVAKNGRRISILANAAHLSMHGASYKLTFVVDITDAQESERKLNESIGRLQNRLKAMEEAQNIVYHDLRTSIGNIIDLTQLLEDDDITDEERQEYFQLIRSLGFRTLSYLDMTLTLRQMESGRYTLQPQVFDLGRLLYNLMQDFKVMSRKKSCELQVTLHQQPLADAPKALAWGEEQLYYFMLSNLIKNAVEASPRGKKVHLDADASDDNQWIIRLQNSGAIPANMRDNFFSKYASSGKRKGTGLGTYLARMVAEIHGGSISYITSEESRRTTITIHLPNQQVS